MIRKGKDHYDGDGVRSKYVERVNEEWERFEGSTTINQSMSNLSRRTLCFVIGIYVVEPFVYPSKDSVVLCVPSSVALLHYQGVIFLKFYDNGKVRI